MAYVVKSGRRELFSEMIYDSMGSYWDLLHAQKRKEFLIRKFHFKVDKTFLIKTVRFELL